MQKVKMNYNYFSSKNVFSLTLLINGFLPQSLYLKQEALLCSKHD